MAKATASQPPAGRLFGVGFPNLSEAPNVVSNRRPFDERSVCWGRFMPMWDRSAGGGVGAGPCQPTACRPRASGWPIPPPYAAPHQGSTAGVLGNLRHTLKGPPGESLLTGPHQLIYGVKRLRENVSKQTYTGICSV